MALDDAPDVKTPVVVLGERENGRSARVSLLQELTHDVVTGLPNRSSFRSLAMQTLKNAVASSLLLIDLDGFKLINDAFGHEAGDALLAEVARRLTLACPQEALVARPGGDEFVILLTSDQAADEAILLAERLHAGIGSAIEIQGREWSLSCSIGIATSCGEEKAAAVTVLLRDAEVAMYRAKSGGRARTVVFEASMLSAAVRRLTLEADLKAAIDRDEFLLHLQPIVRLADGRLKGFEGLTRWQRPGHGLAMPAEFISVLEETGLVVPFGASMIRQACRILRNWQQRFPKADLPYIAVNLSARQFHDPALITTVGNLVRESGIPSSLLRLEVTESLTMQDPEHVACVLRQFAAEGFGVSLDDFGTGYSSLAYLQNFPIDTLKIDRSFVAGMEEEGGSLRIVRAIVGLAASLGLSVVGEGIETESQAALLNQLGCGLGQGYLFSRALAAEDATALVVAAQAMPLPAMPSRSNHEQATQASPARISSSVGRHAAGTLLLIPAFLALHAALIVLFPHLAGTLSALCMAVGPTLAAAGCLSAASRDHSTLRANWIIAAIAFLFWAAGSILSVWLPMQSAAGAVDYTYFLCALALLFAMTAPENDKPRSLFLLIDAVQALFGAILGFLLIFGAMPFTHERMTPLSEQAILQTYDGENICMVLLAALRLLGTDGSATRRRFDTCLLIFTSCFGVLGSLFDHISPDNSTPLDVMLDPAFLFAAVATRWNFQPRVRVAPSRPLTVFLNTVGPAFLTASVLIVAAWIARQRLLLGTISILATAGIYALRVSLLQTRYMLTQAHLRQTRDRLECLALEDGLTGIGNRRAFDTMLVEMWEDAVDRSAPLAALVIDVDFFKAYNDRHGHRAGDECLACVARELKTVVASRGGFVARYGGEEFVALLPGTAEDGAAAIASEVRRSIAALNLTAADGVPAPVTVSIGVAAAPRARTPQCLMLAADDALYRAKHRGRDRVEVEPPAYVPVS